MKNNSFVSSCLQSNQVQASAFTDLINIVSEQRHHKAYLGREFTKAFEEVECSYVGAAGHDHVSLLLLSLLSLINYVF